jgi:hypothetical protein
MRLSTRASACLHMQYCPLSVMCVHGCGAYYNYMRVWMYWLYTHRVRQRERVENTPGVAGEHRVVSAVVAALALTAPQHAPCASAVPMTK